MKMDLSLSCLPACLPYAAKKRHLAVTTGQRPDSQRGPAKHKWTHDGPASLPV